MNVQIIYMLYGTRIKPIDPNPAPLATQRTCKRTRNGDPSKSFTYHQQRNCRERIHMSKSSVSSTSPAKAQLHA